MRFTPKTEEELQIENLLPEGLYNYEVIKSEEKISAKRNEYISLMLKVYDDMGREHFVYSNLAFLKILKHFCDVNELQNKYKAGEIHDSDCVGKNGGKVSIEIEPERPNPNGGMYRPKNKVVDFLSSSSPSTLQPLHVTKQSAEFVDDALPF